MLSFAQLDSFARAYRKALLQPVIAVIWVVMSLFCVVAGPFGTASLSLPGRCFFWPVTIGFGIMVGGLLRVVVRDHLGYRRFWPEAPIIAVLATLLLTPLLVGMARLLAEREHFTPGPQELAGYLFFVSMATSALRHAVAATWPGVGGGADSAPSDPAPPPRMPRPDPAARLMLRLSPQMRAPLIRLQMRDHYVEITTDAGTERVLLRLADAICAAEGVEGMQVHRSHWVAMRAIRGVMRQQGRVALLTCDGAVVPVSRANAPVVLALGLPETSAVSGPFEEDAETEAAQ